MMKGRYKYISLRRGFIQLKKGKIYLSEPDSTKKPEDQMGQVALGISALLLYLKPARTSHLSSVYSC